MLTSNYDCIVTQIMMMILLTCDIIFHLIFFSINIYNVALHDLDLIIVIDYLYCNKMAQKAVLAIRIQKILFLITISRKKIFYYSYIC